MSTYGKYNIASDLLSVCFVFEEKVKFWWKKIITLEHHMKCKTNPFIIANVYKFLSIENKMRDNEKKVNKVWSLHFELVEFLKADNGCDCCQQSRFVDIWVCTMKWVEQRKWQANFDCGFCPKVNSEGQYFQYFSVIFIDYKEAASVDFFSKRCWSEACRGFIIWEVCSLWLNQ